MCLDYNNRGAFFFLIGYYYLNYIKMSLNVLKLRYFLIFQGKPFEYLCVT